MEARTEGSFRASSTMKSLPSPYIFLKGTLLHSIGPPVSRTSQRAAAQSAQLCRARQAGAELQSALGHCFHLRVHDVHEGGGGNALAWSLCTPVLAQNHACQVPAE